MSKNESVMSLLAKDATSGGGIDGSIAACTEIEFVQSFKYANGTKGGCALRAKYEVVDGGTEWNENYGLGKSENFEVEDDGDRVVPTGKQRGLNKGTRAYLFFEHLEKAAKDADIAIGDLISPNGSIQGLRERLESGQLVRLGMVPFTTQGGDVKDVAVIVGFEEGTGKAGKSNRQETRKAAAEDVEEKTVEAIKAILEDGPVKFTDLGNKILAAHKKDPDVNAMIKWAQKENNIASDDRENDWTYNQKKRTLEGNE